MKLVPKKRGRGETPKPRPRIWWAASAALVFGLLLNVAGISAPSRPHAEFSVVPQPVEARWSEGPPFPLGSVTIVACDAAGEEIREVAAQAIEVLSRISALTLKAGPAEGGGSKIILRIDPGLFPDLPEWQRAESYRLSVSAARIVLSAGAAHGLFNGVQTLGQLVSSAGEGRWQVRACEVHDFPRFQWRGLMLDPARHFLPVEFLEKFIGVMASYKYNRLHLHLTDDSGWRIEIKKYPRLTGIGSIRRESPKHGDPAHGDGQVYGPFFYSQDQIRELVAYAKSRQVTLVPEIEIPGHSVAALAAYPELSCTGGPFEVGSRWKISEDILCAGNDATLDFARDVLAEVCELFPGESIHIGGDEAPRGRWKTCPKCQARMQAAGLTKEAQLQTWINQQLGEFLARKGRRIIGWDEIIEGGLTPGAVVMSWRGAQGGIAAVNAGHDVIMSPLTHCYFDFPQATGPHEPESIQYGGVVPIEKVYAYEPVSAAIHPDQRKHLLGAQGNIWGEYIWDGAGVEYFGFPRALALAEVNWSPAESRDLAGFLRRLDGQYRLLDGLRVNYRKPDAAKRPDRDPPAKGPAH